jgi:MoaD family protein
MSNLKLKVKVQYFAAVREIANRRKEIVEVEERSTVLDALRVLAKNHGDKFRDYIFDPQTGTPRPYLQFLVNDESISAMNGLSTVIADNSTLTIIPPVGGG